MPFTAKKLALTITLIVGAANAQLAQAQGGSPFQFELNLLDDYWNYTAPEPASSIEGYLTQRATTYNGLQVAKVLEPAVIRLLESGELDSEEDKALETFAETLEAQPGGIGAALEQLAGSQHANLAAVTQTTTQQLSTQLLATLRTLPTDDAGRFWVQGLGNKGSLDKQRGSTGLKYGTQGLLLGADWALDHDWRLGVMGAKTTSQVDAQRFDAGLDSWHLGGYAVRQDGPLALRLGAIYSRHAGQNKRSINLLDHNQQLKSSYAAQSQTLFSELGYQLGNEDVHVEPFAGLGYQRYHRDSFKETGGLAALNVGSQTQQNVNSTLGLRLATVYRFDDQMSLTPHVSTSWKHLYGEVGSQVRQSFRYAPGLIDGFTTHGTSLDRNSLDVQAGLDLAVSAQHTVGLTYSAQAGSQNQSQGLMGQWRMSF
ncbi:autotransporter domain-containing protein [Pseudomonas sp. ICMP 460]|uniref:autotransporter outer membrane beta-barrel domain-containing protein n=1 Tax=Pseudomonas sp. ICMP 460 TaxID=1718917 RepID=UPI000C0886A8|nr:autotransporter outer membrane beta-barrel domain-containing protein [Pseudomonas sp. ICMP 460]PHN28117.1 transporter [Pseudomonas sp. ICMP 460]